MGPALYRDMNTTQRKCTVPGAWSTDRILEVLGTRVARAAMGGKPQPMAALVVARLEGSK